MTAIQKTYDERSFASMVTQAMFEMPRQKQEEKRGSSVPNRLDARIRQVKE